MTESVNLTVIFTLSSYIKVSWVMGHMILDYSKFDENFFFSLNITSISNLRPCKNFFIVHEHIFCRNFQHTSRLDYAALFSNYNFKRTHCTVGYFQKIDLLTALNENFKLYKASHMKLWFFSLEGRNIVILYHFWKLKFHHYTLWITVNILGQ